MFHLQLSYNFNAQDIDCEAEEKLSRRKGIHTFNGSTEVSSNHW